MTEPQPRATVPMTLPPGVDPARIVTTVFLMRADSGSIDAHISDVLERVPFERRQLAGALRALADVVEGQAEALGS